jgi:hypothetical protein
MWSSARCSGRHARDRRLLEAFASACSASRRPPCARDRSRSHVRRLGHHHDLVGRTCRKPPAMAKYSSSHRGGSQLPNPSVVSSGGVMVQACPARPRSGTNDRIDLRRRRPVAQA